MMTTNNLILHLLHNTRGPGLGLELSVITGVSAYLLSQDNNEVHQTGSYMPLPNSFVCDTMSGYFVASE